VVPQVIVGVGNQNVEDHPPPELPEVFHRGGAVLADGVGNLQVAVRLAVARAQHAHGGEEGNPLSAVPIETA
jgi:hypothetical protein